jgi:hypothetical protein
MRLGNRNDVVAPAVGPLEALERGPKERRRYHSSLGPRRGAAERAGKDAAERYAGHVETIAGVPQLGQARGVSIGVGWGRDRVDLR